MKKMGKNMIELACPLCDNIYLLESWELNEISINDEESRDWFKCPNCDRGIIIPKNYKYMRCVKVRTE